MGFAEFSRGLTSEQVEYLQNEKKTRLLRERFNNLDDSLQILRPWEENLPGGDERFKIWNNKDSH